MKKLTSNNLFWLILALALFGGSRTLDYYQNKTNDHKKFVAQLEFNFQQKEKEAQKLLNSFIKFTPEQTLNKNIRFYSDLYDRKGIALYAYKNDTLVAWTENRIPLSEIYPTELSKKNCIKLGNGWYAIIKLNVLLYKGIALIQIKNEYPYQNDYLKNTFQEDLGLSNEDVITLSETPLNDNLFFSNNSFVCGLKIYHYSRYNSLVNAISVTLSLLSLLLALSAFIKSYKQFVSSKIGNYEPLVNIFLILLARWLMLQLRVPGILYDLEIFNPRIYAYNNLFPSLGDYILNSITLVALVTEWKKVRLNYFYKFPLTNSIALFLKPIFTTLFLWIVLKITSDLPYNSSLSFNISNLAEINAYGYLALGGSFLFFVSAYIVLKNFLKSTTALDKKRQLFQTLILISFTVTLCFFNLKLGITSSVIISLVILFIHFWVLSSKSDLTLTYLFGIVGGVSLFYTQSILQTVESNEASNRKLLIDHLSAETDQVVEQLFPLLEKNLTNDSLLQKITTTKNEKNLNLFESKKVLEQKYFNGYWEKYDINFFVYNRFGDPVLETAYLPASDISTFESTVARNKKTENSKYLYHLKTDNGKIAYLARIPVRHRTTGRLNGTAFILIQAKYLTDDIGFPELLLNKKPFDDKKFKDYSYAKYKNYNLISRYGKFSYPLTSASFTQTGKSYYEMVKENYLHSVSQLPDNTQIIVSTPLKSDFFSINIFSALLIYYLSLALVFIAVSRFKTIKNLSQISLRTRIQAQLLVVLLFSFILLGYGTIKSFKNQFNQQNLKEISNKTRAVLIEIEDKLGNERSLSPLSSEYLNYLLSKFSNTFSTDINLFDKSGNLKASSKLQLFEQKLISTKINPEAYFYLSNQEKTEFLHQEKIGELKYLSAYVPLRNKQNKILGYINLPYFSKQGELESEISNFLISLINIYLILFVFSIFVSLLISNRITYPLVILKDKISAIKLGQKNELIIWKGNDEIAALVNEYNRMVIELMNSAEQLAQTEREGAWKEMAKQVAHEIKNPLTPIKLSVQLLERAWNDGAPDFDKKLKRFSETLIEQIDTLSNIASQFSNFAQMPNPNIERVNLNETITTAANLFRNLPSITIKTNLPEKNIYINADKDYLVRILNNLIKNAIQAIEKEKQGLIEISLKIENDNKISLSIKDNGMGIPDEIKPKIFNPNFTTKTTGSGLGLAMVKNMTELMGGEIIFVSEKGKGTEFMITFTGDV